MSVVHWRMLENGWTFEDGPGVVLDPNLGAKFLYEIYIASDPNYTGRVTVPVLWDKRRGAIVNNESSEIIRMMNCAFNALGAKSGDYYPEELPAKKIAPRRLQKFTDHAAFFFHLASNRAMAATYAKEKRNRKSCRTLRRRSDNA